ncbi:hypothetical protein J2847_002993 [Azospirillum agricola]|uniref:hypothetical protein n=1 Tax=Azospirillum agricola TaxID=1720247 RepID=UPI001AE1B686|nr:hypothetical protein [Azospirillum agricola]MBP2229694.1 hypothetical protein [Azospirillum agricola]
MGESKRKKSTAAAGVPWPQEERREGQVNLRQLAPHPRVGADRIRELTGESAIPPGTKIALNAFRARSGEHEFLVGFSVGDGQRFSAIGLAVVERLMIEAGSAALHVVPISDADIAWDIVLRHLRTFTGTVLVFAFSDSRTYDAVTAEMFYSEDIVLQDPRGARIRRLTEDDRRRVRQQAADMGATPPPPKFYDMPGADPKEQPWIFGLPCGDRTIRLTVWNGRKDFIHEFPTDIVDLVGGDRIAIVQVGSPVGVNGRSSVALSRHFSDRFDGIVHWARDTETYRSIIRELVLADIPSVSRPVLPDGWTPEVVIMPVGE